MKAVILAAGKGGNVSPFSKTRPISMVSVAGNYLFDNTVNLLKKSGINDIFVVVGHQKEKVIKHISEQDELNIQYVEQKKIGEIGNAVFQMKDKILKGNII